MAKQKSARRENDLYETDPALTRVVMDVLGDRLHGRLFEPCAGRDAIAAVLREAGHSVMTNDVDCDLVKEFGHDYCFDATLPQVWDIWARARIDWVVTNCPFKHAFPILEQSWEHVRVGVAMLFRLTFLEPTQDRGVWLEHNAPYMSNVIVFGQPRPSFTAGGTDFATTMWVVWDKTHSPERGTRFSFEYNWR